MATKKKVIDTDADKLTAEVAHFKRMQDADYEENREARASQNSYNFSIIFFVIVGLVVELIILYVVSR